LHSADAGAAEPDTRAWRCPGMQRQGNHVVETATQARAGVTGQKARYVLAWSTLGVIVAFAIVYFYFFA
jgi:hypothetical protein